MKKDFEEGIHYYIEGERVVFTALFHLQRDKCCGKGCRHCPYDPIHQKDNKIIQKEFVYLKEKA